MTPPIFTNYKQPYIYQQKNQRKNVLGIFQSYKEKPKPKQILQ